MALDLQKALPRLLPKAAVWAEAESGKALASGTPLLEAEIALASWAGVRCPERIRLKLVQAIPLPEDAELREAALQTGLLGPDTIGLALGYAVLVREHVDACARLLSHEFRHVHQFESYGSIKAFLSVYLPQIVQFGYANAPLEIDARAHESATGSRDGPACAVSAPASFLAGRSH
jgi:hypothetical protein